MKPINQLWTSIESDNSNNTINKKTSFFKNKAILALSWIMLPSQIVIADTNTKILGKQWTMTAMPNWLSIVNSKNTDNIIVWWYDNNWTNTNWNSTILDKNWSVDQSKIGLLWEHYSPDLNSSTDTNWKGYWTTLIWENNATVDVNLSTNYNLDYNNVNSWWSLLSGEDNITEVLNYAWDSWLIWQYDNWVWSANTNNTELNSTLNELGYNTDINLTKDKAFWLYQDPNSVIPEYIPDENNAGAEVNEASISFDIIEDCDWIVYDEPTKTYTVDTKTPSVSTWDWEATLKLNITNGWYAIYNWIIYNNWDNINIWDGSNSNIEIYGSDWVLQDTRTIIWIW